MSNKRVIPLLLLHNDLLYKTISFGDYKYIGDPLVAVKIFNEKEAEELCIIDSDASRNKSSINFKLLEEIAGECFMPLSYGGGVQTISDIIKLNQIGFEKIIINSAFHKNISFVKEAIQKFGSSTIIGAIDYKIIKNRKICYFDGGESNTNIDLISVIDQMTEIGVGEILINCIDLEGTKSGIDNNTLKEIKGNVLTPLIYSGGIGSIQDIKAAFDLGADAIAAGSMFVYLGKMNAVLINYPDKKLLETLNE